MIARRGRTAVVGFVAAVALGLVGCGVPSTDGAKPLPSDLAAIAQPPTDAETTAPHTSPVRVTWVHGKNLVPTRRLVEGVGRQELLDAALATVVAGPDARELGAGLTTFVPPDAQIAAVLSRRSAVVSLDLGLQSPIDPSLAVGQVALTALASHGVRKVLFLVDGSVVNVPLPGGGTSRKAVTKRDYRGVIAHPRATP